MKFHRMKITVTIFVVLIAIIIVKVFIGIANDARMKKYLLQLTTYASEQYNSGNILESRRAYTKCLSIDRSNYESIIGLSNIEYRLNGYEAAIDMLKACQEESCNKHREYLNDLHLYETEVSHINSSNAIDFWNNLTKQHGSFCAAERLVKSIPLSSSQKESIFPIIVENISNYESKRINDYKNWFSYYLYYDGEPNDKKDDLANTLFNQTINQIVERGLVIGADSLYRDWNDSEGMICTDVNSMFDKEEYTKDVANFGPESYRIASSNASSMFQKFPSFNNDDRQELHRILFSAATIGLLQEEIVEKITDVNNIYKWKVYSAKIQRTLPFKDFTIVKSRNSLRDYFSSYYVINNNNGVFSKTQYIPHFTQNIDNEFLYFYDSYENEKTNILRREKKSNIGRTMAALDVYVSEHLYNIFPISDNKVVCQNKDYDRIIYHDIKNYGNIWSIEFKEPTKIIEISFDNNNLYAIIETYGLYTKGKRLIVINYKSGLVVDEFQFKDRQLENNISLNKTTTIIKINKNEIKSYGSENGEALWKKKYLSNIRLFSSSDTYTVCLEDSNYTIYVYKNMTGEIMMKIPFNNGSSDSIYSIDILGDSKVFINYGDMYYLVNIEDSATLEKLDDAGTKYIGKINNDNILIKTKDYLYLIDYKKLSGFLNNRKKTYYYPMR